MRCSIVVLEHDLPRAVNLAIVIDALNNVELVASAREADIGTVAGRRAATARRLSRNCHVGEKKMILLLIRVRAQQSAVRIDNAILIRAAKTQHKIQNFQFSAHTGCALKISNSGNAYLS